jgi:hypothetical protein
VRSLFNNNLTRTRECITRNHIMKGWEHKQRCWITMSRQSMYPVMKSPSRSLMRKWCLICVFDTFELMMKLFSWHSSVWS